MAKGLISDVANELNERAAAFNIGNLQDIRSRVHGRRRSARTIFDRRTIFENYAFHVGGRKELQFNIGIENISDAEEFRYGVAFSLELGRNLVSLDLLLLKIKRFNEFIRLESDRYSDLRMWWWQRKARSSDSSPAPIFEELATAGTFIFLGQHKHIKQFDYNLVLSTFDRLLPLYEFVESKANDQSSQIRETTKFKFKPGIPPRSIWATASLAQKELDIRLRHNEIQVALHHQLVTRYGSQNVGVENEIGLWGKIDLAVRTDKGLWIYEIKTASSARTCIREAMGQLLEYSLWPGTPKVAKLVVVGEALLDNKAKEYLQRLNRRFPLPINYQRVVIDSDQAAMRIHKPPRE